MNLFHPKAVFRGVKDAFFLDIAGKMQSLGLLCPIEKFAEIHRQVSLCSLTTAGLGVPTCFFGLNPFQLQNAPHSALKLHLPFFEMGLRWAAISKPQQGTSFPAPFLRYAGKSSRKSENRLFILFILFQHSFNMRFSRLLRILNAAQLRRLIAHQGNKLADLQPQRILHIPI